MAFLYFGKKEPPFVVDGVKSWVNCHHNISKKYRKYFIPPHVPPKEKYHSHDYIELLYGVDAIATVWINDKPYSLNTGDMVIIYSNELHDLQYHNQHNLICIQFSPEILYANEQSLFEFKYISPNLNAGMHQRTFHQGELGNLDFGALITETMKEWQAKESGYEPIIRGNILKIFGEIYRFWNKNNNDILVLTEPIKKALVYISDNLQTVTEADVAKHVNLTPNYFSNTFKKVVGQNFKEYLTSLKIKEVEKLLISTNKTITEIAFELGFSSTSHLIAQFKKRKNITPKQFIISLRNGN